ncbi:MAG: molecular chaperone DnaJ [Myxococcales bacterium]|nr:molecular chaperone DnaJ [Myxococcales bacterium]
MDKRDYYEVLGVERGAGDAAIKSAYRRCAMQHHPDRNPGDQQSEERFKEAAEAYGVLSDAEKRALYDQFGHAGPRRSGFEGFSGMEDIFSHFADVFGGGGGRGGQRRGGDLQTRLQLTFQEAVKGCQKEITFDRHVPCSRCSGSGARPGSQPVACPTCGGRGQVMQSMGFVRIASTCPACRGQGRVVKDKCDGCGGGGVERKRETVTIDIPAGVDEGNTMRVPGRGQASAGGPAGHLYVEFSVTADPRFEREGDDLIATVPISYAQAVLGATVAIPTIDGDESLDVEPGTQPGTVRTLRGRGVPHVEARGRGDLHVRLQVVVPKRLDDEQRKLIEQLAALDGASDLPEADSGGFFRRRKKKK